MCASVRMVLVCTNDKTYTRILQTCLRCRIHVRRSTGMYIQHAFMYMHCRSLVLSKCMLEYTNKTTKTILSFNIATIKNNTFHCVNNCIYFFLRKHHRGRRDRERNLLQASFVPVLHSRDRCRGHGRGRRARKAFLEKMQTTQDRPQKVEAATARRTSMRPLRTNLTAAGPLLRHKLENSIVSTKVTRAVTPVV